MTLFILSRINIVRYLEFYRQFRLAGMRFVAARPRITRPTVICNWQPKRYYKSDSIEPSFTLRNPVILEDNNKTVHLLGTAHISETSAREVRKLIKRVQPQQVQRRYYMPSSVE
jgi:hypothetical protein